ncbi:MAG: alpha-hydroxy-acid oxidizing protein [Rhodospirillaceae bacterium]|jgi:L-lactate dehydrogenase (cytochrome)|nr:alpha-hydroxy-acid oxidizing protein [Rhodospirillaceae bacterium]MBT6537168.1 alpha-hydroxy-acid oxidizing protein [Rhodospirillaceae bacterium]
MTEDNSKTSTEEPDYKVTAGRPDTSTRAGQLKMLYPTIADLRTKARKRVPRFAFDYVDGAAGADEPNRRGNAAALDGIEILPRYGGENYRADTSVELFGKRYAGPLAIAPMGLPGLVLPGGEKAFARAAAANEIPFTLGSSALATVEEVSELANGYAWFQIYRMPRDNLAINMDWIARATAAEVGALVVTIDVPARTKRPRELRNRLVLPYKIGPRTIADVATRPAWLRAYFRHGQNLFANLQKYVSDNPTPAEVAEFARGEGGGSFTWEEIARFRDAWKGPLIIKGILHPGDAEKSVELGADGIVVSNHGGRQLEAAPASVDMLPGIVAAVGGKTEILFDGGLRSGVDLMRSAALGARFNLVGRAFMYGLAALGEDGPGFVADFFIEELREALRQVGARDLSGARDLDVRHPTAWKF